ncbi:MAG: protein TolA, partial [Deltaproteobacteria bacterium]|nr:protein TolA [Deltaproteobacteria bacterium]
MMSFCLHAGFVLGVLFWPSSPPHIPIPPSITVSLVNDLPGGNKTPSPVLSPQSAPVQRQEPPPPAPPKEAPPPEAP